MMTQGINPRGAPKRNRNAFKHGFAAKLREEKSFLICHKDLIVALTRGARGNKKDTGERLLESLVHLRRIAAAEAALINAETQRLISGVGADSDRVSQADAITSAYTKLAPALKRLHRYEREAACRFASAYRAYIIAQETVESPRLEF